MIRPSVKTTDSGAKGMKDFIARMKKTPSSAYVSIGVHEDAGEYPDGQSVAEVALWNEFGTRHSPERSFFRSAIDEAESNLEWMRWEMLENMYFKGWDMKKALETVGFRIQTLVQNKIKSNVPPPLAKSTADAKQKEGVAQVTLIDTKLLLRSIVFKVFGA